MVVCNKSWQVLGCARTDVGENNDKVMISDSLTVGVLSCMGNKHAALKFTEVNK